MKGSATLEKSLGFSGIFFFMPKEASSGFWNHQVEFRKVWNIPEIWFWFIFSI